jgi:hypothetical protein
MFTAAAVVSHRVLAGCPATADGHGHAAVLLQSHGSEVVGSGAVDKHALQAVTPQGQRDESDDIPTAATTVPTDPPFRGTVWLCGDKLIPPDAPTAFAGLRRRGVGPRMMFDRRLQEGGDPKGVCCCGSALQTVH